MQQQLSRAEEIEKQLGLSYLIRGQKVPSNGELSFQASLINEKLNPNIEIKHIEALFDISRVKSWQPALTELERAFKSDEFRKVFPRKAYENSNLYISPKISKEQEEEFERNRKSIKVPWSKK